MRSGRTRQSAPLVRAVVGVGVYVAIPLHAVVSGATFLVDGASRRARRALCATGEAVRKIMVGVIRAGQRHACGRWVRKGPARCRKQAARTWTSARKAARRTAAGGIRRLARLRDLRGAR